MDILISTTTFSSCLRRAYIRFGKPAVHIDISQVNIDNRLAWAVANLGRDLSNFVHSDEKIFIAGARGNKIYYELHHRPIILANRWSARIHIWWAISKYARFESFVIEGRLNSESFQEVLTESLLPCTREEQIFQQDSAPVHVSRSTLEFLARNDVPLLEDWPAQSPDLNPIKHAWAQAQKIVAERNPANAAELKAVVLDVLRTFPQDSINRLIDSVPDRLQKVIEKQGRFLG